ncbi:hypothetical protein ACFFJY_01970 [Fictibacillus aquaticus]|uniref:Uncharacterized protein n=1 Tax=Fictibacillus aquaticus TaxID=2021314 RepID=A0A235F888_9BACL|nr:hypothetical protein [Fictibacillus aquaticus]OYD57478.1 hypothetical protein CGZ90_12435 [Fictibacillus aquaticus]
MTFEELKSKKPTAEWLENDEDGDFFNEENISVTNKVLDAYISTLQKLGSGADEDDIMEAVEEVVTRLNELNEEYDDYIETSEREDLCEFIQSAAEIAGLHSEEDITEEWREW